MPEGLAGFMERRTNRLSNHHAGRKNIHILERLNTSHWSRSSVVGKCQPVSSWPLIPLFKSTTMIFENELQVSDVDNETVAETNMFLGGIQTNNQQLVKPFMY